jgi:hypothetical protein
VARAVLLPKLCNPLLPPSAVLAALVIHALLHGVMQGIFAVFTNA